MKPNTSPLTEHLDYLKLPFIKKHHGALAKQAAERQWSHVDYLGRFLDGEFNERRQRRIARRIKAARFPIIKTLEQFGWDWLKILAH